MQATLSPFYSFGYSTHTAYEFSSDVDILRTRYATSSCRDEPAHDPTAPKYDPLGVLSKPAPPVWEKPVYTRTKLVVVNPSTGATDNTFTPRDPRAVEMAAATSPRTLAWARDQPSKVDQSIWALAALSLAHSPWADNYSHFWGEDVRADTARFVFSAGAHNLIRTTRRTDPPLHSDVDLYRDVVRAYKTWEESLKPSVVAAPTRTSPRVAQNKRKAVIAAAIETVEEAIEAQDAKEPELTPLTTKRTRPTVARKRAAGSPTHAPVISSPLAHSVLLPAADIDSTPAPTRASQRPKKKSQLAREAEEHAAAAADETRPTTRRAASSSASSDVSSITATSASPSAPAMAAGKRSRSGSASSASTAVDVVAELAKSEERPAKKARTTKQTSVAPTPEPESEDVPADQTVANEKASKSPVRKRAPRAQTNRTRKR